MDLENKVERAIWHYLKQFVTSEKFLKNKFSKTCTMPLSETSCYFRENFENNVRKYAFWRFLKWFGTAEKMKTMSLKYSIWHNLKQFGTAEKTNENNVSKECILAIFDTIWNSREKIKTRALTCACWHYLKRYFKLQWITLEMWK